MRFWTDGLEAESLAACKNQAGTRSSTRKEIALLGELRANGTLVRLHRQQSRMSNQCTAD